MVCSGMENFNIQLGPFNYLALDALAIHNFIPDFNAEVISYAKILKIKKSLYARAIAETQKIVAMKKEQTEIYVYNEV